MSILSGDGLRGIGTGTVTVAHRGVATAVVLTSYFLLTFLVWGVTAPHRGFWQDDATLLGVSFDRDPTTLELFDPIVSPTRRLLSLPFVAAAHTSAPILTLHLIYGAIWLGIGLLARDLTRRLGGDEVAAYVAGALTLCATSDFLTNSPIELGYDTSAILILAAFCTAVRWIQGRSATWLVGSVALSQASLWTYDGSLPSYLLCPLLFWASARRDTRNRAVIATVTWAGAVIPYGLVLAPFLTDPSSYASVALAKLPLSTRMIRTATLLTVDFSPWQWVNARPVWLHIPEPWMPTAWFLASAAVGIGVFLGVLWWLQRRPEEAANLDEWPLNTFVALTFFGGAAAASHGALAGAQFWEVHYRTQNYSRIWCSILLALVLRIAARRWRRGRWFAAAIAAAFVGFGVAGGMERQEFFVATWSHQRKELVSLVREAPLLAPQSVLVLVQPPTPSILLATEADYLAKSWTMILYPPASRPQVFLWNVERGALCRYEASVLRCFNEAEFRCASKGACEGTAIPFDRLVMLEFQPASGEYRMVDRLDAVTYNPRARVVGDGPTKRQRRVLFETFEWGLAPPATPQHPPD
jgi:hypothetical protein